MSETTPKTPREVELEGTLDDSGIPLHRFGPGIQIGMPNNPGFLPTVTLFCRSEVPTEDEVEALKQVAEGQAAFFEGLGHSRIGFYVQAAVNELTFTKFGPNEWRYRRTTWDDGWSKDALPLQDLRKELGK